MLPIYINSTPSGKLTVTRDGLMYIVSGKSRPMTRLWLHGSETVLLGITAPDGTVRRAFTRRALPQRIDYASASETPDTLWYRNPDGTLCRPMGEYMLHAIPTSVSDKRCRILTIENQKYMVFVI